MNPAATKRHRDVDFESCIKGFTPDVSLKRRPGLFERLEGNYLFGTSGEQVFDGFSPLWCCGMTPGNLGLVFFMTGGSATVDTAPKITTDFHRIKSDATRFRIIGRERGTHSVSLDGISVEGTAANRKVFTTMILPGVDHLSHTRSHARRYLLQGTVHVGAHPASDIERPRIE